MSRKHTEQFSEGLYFEPVRNEEGNNGRRRAAAYCRVSKMVEEQDLSFESQISYYRKMISEDPDLMLVGIYGDHGVSGLSISKRKGFQKMMADCEAGKIDVIFVKSISRFSRNAAESIETMKHLKGLGIRVAFEKEGLDNMDPTTELVINIYATIAQNESCSQSENLIWAYRQRARSGNPSRRPCFGYIIEKRLDDSFLYWVVDEGEASIVRKVFDLAYQGYTSCEIAREVGLDMHRIYKMLRNEAYKGDILTHKNIKLDCIGKEIRNTGHREQVYIEGHHEPIVAPDVFDTVQFYIKERLLDIRYRNVRKEWLANHPEIIQRRCKAGK